MLTRRQAENLDNLLQELMAAVEDGDSARSKSLIHKIADQIRVDTADSPPFDSARYLARSSER